MTKDDTAERLDRIIEASYLPLAGDKMVQFLRENLVKVVRELRGNQ